MIAKLALAMMFLLGAVARPAIAEHQVSSRYTVLGYVKDAQGRAQAGVEVELIREKTGFSYLVASDASGFYVIVVRLGDESAGERLRLRAGAQATSITARFDPADDKRERGTRVDFLGPKPQEQLRAFEPTLKRFLAQ